MGNLIPAPPRGINNPYGLDALPGRAPLNKSGYIPGNPVKPLPKPPMIRLKGRMSPDIRVRMSVIKILKVCFHTLMQGSLVFFQGKQIISLCGNNLAGYIP
jgi:hypothetical protein